MNCNTTHYRANSSSVPGDPTLPTQEGGTGTAPVPAPGGTPTPGQVIGGRVVIDQSTKPYYCPAGTFMTSLNGNHVCQIGATGSTIRVIPR